AAAVAGWEEPSSPQGECEGRSMTEVMYGFRRDSWNTDMTRPSGTPPPWLDELESGRVSMNPDEFRRIRTGFVESGRVSMNPDEFRRIRTSFAGRVGVFLLPPGWYIYPRLREFSP